MLSIGTTNGTNFLLNGIERTFGSFNAYSLLSGNLSLSNSVTATGMATTLYTGNGATQSVVTGVDMATQWGNSATETFGGLVWTKNRGAIGDNGLFDTINGATNFIVSNLNAAQTTSAQTLTAFTSTGFNLGTAGFNTNTNTYASWNFQTTHRTSGTTNHGKAYTCHYNPFTGFTMVKYEGSGLAGHEIPHHLGRKLGFVAQKGLTTGGYSWRNQYKANTNLYFESTSAEAAGDVNGYFSDFNENSSILANGGIACNTSTNQYIMYGWANSYFDEANTLIGNYEVGVYQGTGVAGNKVTTRGKPAWVMVKRVDSTGSWFIYDNKRTNDGYSLLAESSAVEASTDDLDFVSDGISIKTTTVNINTSGGQYLYMVVYDNDSGSGKSKYPRATDTSALNLNAVIPFANGLDNNGTKNAVLTKNETVSGLTLTQGKNYVYAKSDGTYGVKAQAPQYGSYNGFGDYFDVNTNKWYQSPSVFSNDLSSGSAWTTHLGTASWVVANGTGSLNGDNGFVDSVVSTQVGKVYKVIVDVVSLTGTGIFNISSASNGTGDIKAFSTASLGINSFTFVATTSTVYLGIDTSSYVSISSYCAYPINNDGSVDTSSATPITESRNYLDAIVYADAGGQPTYIEQLPKIEYKDVVKANEYQGKNACTAWVNFDGTTTPPTIRDSFNVSAVIRTANGVFDIYFKTPMDNVNYDLVGAGWLTLGNGAFINVYNGQASKTINKVQIISNSHANAITSPSLADIQIFGGKN